MPMQDVEKTNIKQGANAKRIRRRNRWLPLYVAVVLILTVGIGLTLSITVFFNVETIVVTGEAQQYTVEQIVRAANVYSGDNLVKLNTEEVEQKIYENPDLIYIESVKVRKQFPDVLVIDVQKCRESYNIVYDGGILLTSATGKIISNSGEAGTNLPTFYGYLPSITTVGQKVESTDAQKDKIFSLFASIIGKELSCPITSVDMSDKYDIRVCFDNRIVFDLGNWNELEYKITLAETVIPRLGTNKSGYLIMVGNHQCAFRDAAMVGTQTPIKIRSITPSEPAETTAAADGAAVQTTASAAQTQTQTTVQTTVQE